MAVDYVKITSEMADGVAYTASDLGISGNSAAAMARRGLVKCIGGTPKQYVKVYNPIHEILDILKDKTYTYFFLKKKDHTIGMLCSLSKNTIKDCWGNPYDLTDVVELEVNNTKYQLNAN